MIHMNYCICLLLLSIVYVYNCEEICNITISIKENTSIEKLKWNLMDFIVHRNSLQFSLSNPSDYFQIESTILKYRLKEFDREKLCQYDDECSLQLQIFTQTSVIILFKLIILDENDCKPFFNENDLHLIIRENLPMNYRVQLPIAYDYDSVKYNIKSYEFVNNTEEIERIFQLEKTYDQLQLKLLKQLDCELKSNYQLYITAIDKGGLQSNILYVFIIIFRILIFFSFQTC